MSSNIIEQGMASRASQVSQAKYESDENSRSSESSHSYTPDLTPPESQLTTQSDEAANGASNTPDKFSQMNLERLLELLQQSTDQRSDIKPRVTPRSDNPAGDSYTAPGQLSHTDTESLRKLLRHSAGQTPLRHAQDTTQENQPVSDLSSAPDQLSQHDIELLRGFLQESADKRRSQTSNRHFPQHTAGQYKKPMSTPASASHSRELGDLGVADAVLQGFHNTWIVLRFYLVLSLPYLIPALSHIVVPSLGVLFFGLIALRSLQAGCPHGVSIISPIATVFGLSDICSTSSTSSPTAKLLGDDPTGIATVLEWAASSKEIVAARKNLADMSYGAAIFVADTEAWQNSIPEGHEIHEMSLSYRDLQDKAEDQIDEVFYGHTAYIDRVSFDVKFLSDNLHDTLNSYGAISYFLAHYWYSRQDSPLGRMERDFIKFYDHQAGMLQSLIDQTANLVATLKETKKSRISLKNKVSGSWRAWENACMGNTKGLLNSGWGIKYDVVVGEHPKCSKYDPKKLQRIMKQELGAYLDDVQEYASKQLKSYKALQNSHRSIARSMNDGKEKSRVDTTTLRSYRNIFGSIEEKIQRASDALKEAMRDGRFDTLE